MPKRGGRGGKNAPTQDEDSSHVVFGDAKSAKKKEKQRAEPQGEPLGGQNVAAAQRTDTRALIGGASWTGKLPMNLLSEHCQKVKWHKPEYTMNHNAEGYSSMVILKNTNPKTRETETLPPFKLPPTLKHLALQPSAIEARHFAATYALFRICSMKNIHMMLPPNYRELWKKEFQNLKVADIKEGNDWMYEADPFAAKQQREEGQAQAAKKREEREKQKAKEAENPIVSLSANRGTSNGLRSNFIRGWIKAPKVEMGKRMRADVESIVRKGAMWNPYGILMPEEMQRRVVDELTDFGFRKSHVEEAAEECKDREESLEWLLIHVPEDDLPKWALPEGYSAGLSMARSNMKREAAIKRLAAGGYSLELCSEYLNKYEHSEAKAAEALQANLIDMNSIKEGMDDLRITDSEAVDDLEGDVWEMEMPALESIYGSRVERVSDTLIRIQLDVHSLAAQPVLRVAKSSRYPELAPVINIIADSIPSYIKLSITRQAVRHANDNLRGESMVFGIVDWLEEEIPNIIENPGQLKTISAGISGSREEESTPKYGATARARPKPQVIDWRPGNNKSVELFHNWQQRQASPQQQKMLAIRQSLPAWKMKEAIVAAVSKNQVTIIAGETGSGKSTQSVQFILDEMIMRQLGSAASIVCTQPRRISALGLADRVSAERCSSVGDEVGYTIRGEHKHSKNTKITFVTTGVLLRKLQTSGDSKEDLVAALADVSHVVVDEVHERSLDTDFLLVLLKDVLAKRKDLKLILMSATLDASIFRDYFGGQVGFVEIEGRTYPVEDQFLDDVVRFTGFSVLSDDKRSGSANDSDLSIPKTIQSMGMGINYDLIKSLVTTIDMDLGSVVEGGILIFLPGTFEISRTLQALQSLSSIYALPLHASLTPTEQRRVFPPAPRGKRKVIATTNVAETSLTIEDIVAVIDTGKVKETSFDPSNKMVKLEEVWASRAACKQRRGRAGRVREGQCYKLYTKNAEAKMAERPEPEIRRVPLEQLCLSVRAMGIVDVPNFLASALTPPETTAVEGAMDLLARMGALDGDQLTALGRHISLIPADLRCGKLIVYGAMFGCLEACLTIAAILSSRTPFLSPQDKRDESKSARKAFAPTGQGDLICDLHAYNEWSALKANSSYRDVRQFCDDNFLSQQTLNDIASTRSQLLSSVSDAGFLPSTSNISPNPRDHNTNLSLLRALIAAAFTPNIATISFPDKKYAPSVSGAVELDPEARTIKFFSQSSTIPVVPPSSNPSPLPQSPTPQHLRPTDTGRLFIHPSSTLFSAQSFPGTSAFLTYFSKMQTSKIFIRECTPFNIFALLMFCGKLEVDQWGRGVVVDGWVKVRGWARLGVLVGRLRGMLDRELGRRFEGGGGGGRDGGEGGDGGDGMGEEVVGVVRRLVEFDGLDA